MLRVLLKIPHLLFILILDICMLLNKVGSASADQSICACPGKDGPGTVTVAVGSKSISMGTSSGASTAISPGNLLRVIQMQSVYINSTCL